MPGERGDDVRVRRRAKGRTIKLERGSSVFVGRIEGGDERVVEFVNDQGSVTAFRLSHEATMALKALLVSEDRPRDGAIWMTLDVTVDAPTDRPGEA